MFITILVIILMFSYLAYIVLETLYIKKIRKSFKYIIHVNGIRGKSTTTRLIDAGFRECGFKVFSKTTGTLPMMINTQNEDVLIKRLGSANIREQISMLRKAYKEHADVLVLECMAVNPKLQKICEEKILTADVTIITNVRKDHLDEMGNTLADIALSFTNTIPKNGHLIVNNSEYLNIFNENAKRKNTIVHVAKEYTGNDNLDTFNENIALALEVANTLGLDKDVFFNGMKKYHHDIGAYEEIKYDDTIFLNGFSINDPESIKMVYNEILKKYDANDITILLNNRFDRPTRVLQHIELMQELNCKKILIFGSNANYIKKRIINKNCDIVILNDIEELKKEKIIFAIGNIGGKGMEILKFFRNKGINYDN